MASEGTTGNQDSPTTFAGISKAVLGYLFALLMVILGLTALCSFIRLVPQFIEECDGTVTKVEPFKGGSRLLSIQNRDFHWSIDSGAVPKVGDHVLKKKYSFRYEINANCVFQAWDAMRLFFKWPLWMCLGFPSGLLLLELTTYRLAGVTVLRPLKLGRDRSVHIGAMILLGILTVFYWSAYGMLTVLTG